jgi:multidrug efflux pump subunit AcrB
MSQPYGFAGRLASAFIDSKLTPLIILAALAAGVFATISLPREEEPQIIVPMIDVIVQAPGMTAREVERRVTQPMEKLLWEIPGVEYIYSTSSPGMSLAVVRYKVGSDETQSVVKTYNKMYSNFDRIPPGVSQPLIKPRWIDDVAVLSLTLWGEGYSEAALRQIAANVIVPLEQVPDVSEVLLIGGQRRAVRVLLDPTRLSGYHLSAGAVVQLLQGANQRLGVGSVAQSGREVQVDAGSWLMTTQDVEHVVVGVFGGRPVHVSEVAEVRDGPEDPTQYVRFAAGPAAAEKGIKGVAAGRNYGAVTISLAKRTGTNAATVVGNVLAKLERMRGHEVPDDVHFTVTRNYGETATEKSNELLKHMAIAIIAVTLLIALTLGFRESGVVLLAIPTTLALTMMVFLLKGYTLNRITLFALIFTIGILVDDAIVVVENIVRHFRMATNRGRSLLTVATEAVDEVGNPTILATFAVVAAILPLAFVRGLMGPYMRPIPVGASAAMVFSLLIAFLVSPYASVRLLKHAGGHGEHSNREGLTTRLYRRVMGRLIHDRRAAFGFLGGIMGLLLIAMLLLPAKLVVVKMLPFDNKSEFQVIIDAPEGATLEQTAAAARTLSDYMCTVPEVTDVQSYVGTAGPYNFNGLVRHYFMRQGPNVADLQVNLVPKGKRQRPSHIIAKTVRDPLTKIAGKFGVRIKVLEVPPGPPVMSTLVAEVYGPTHEERVRVGHEIERIFLTTSGVVDADTYIEGEQPEFTFVPDREKAALAGIDVNQIARTLAVAVHGTQVGLVHQPEASEDIPVTVELPRGQRPDLEALKSINVQAPNGTLIPLGELVQVEETGSEQSIYHKNLLPVVYVIGEVGGKYESPVYSVLGMQQAVAKLPMPGGYTIKQFATRQPTLTEQVGVKWDGEWHITYEVFRDLGLAFAAVLVLIYILVVGWFQNFKTPILIMAAIPMSLIGILPGHWLMGAFFTATSMIGFIAGAGIVVRNSIILVDFIELRLRQGMPLDEAVIDAGVVRFRPMMLTAAAVFVGASVLLFDPIFQGMAVSLMAGEVASLFLSRMAVPVLYYLAGRKPAPTVAAESGETHEPQ